MPTQKPVTEEDCQKAIQKLQDDGPSGLKWRSDGREVSAQMRAKEPNFPVQDYIATWKKQIKEMVEVEPEIKIEQGPKEIAGDKVTIFFRGEALLKLAHGHSNDENPRNESPRPF